MGSAIVTRPRPRPRPPQTLSCVHSTGHKFEPIVFIFGMGIDCGKISTPIDFGRVPRSKMAAAGHFGKKIKTSDFRSKTRFRQFPAKKKKKKKKKFQCNFFFGSGLTKFSGFFFFFFFPPPRLHNLFSGNFRAPKKKNQCKIFFGSGLIENFRDFFSVFLASLNIMLILVIAVW